MNALTSLFAKVAEEGDDLFPNYAAATPPNSPARGLEAEAEAERAAPPPTPRLRDVMPATPEVVADGTRAKVRTDSVKKHRLHPQPHPSRVNSRGSIEGPVPETKGERIHRKRMEQAGLEQRRFLGFAAQVERDFALKEGPKQRVYMETHERKGNESGAEMYRRLAKEAEAKLNPEERKEMEKVQRAMRTRAEWDAMRLEDEEFFNAQCDLLDQDTATDMLAETRREEKERRARARELRAAEQSGEDGGDEGGDEEAPTQEQLRKLYEKQQQQKRQGATFSHVDDMSDRPAINNYHKRIEELPGLMASLAIPQAPQPTSDPTEVANHLASVERFLRNKREDRDLLAEPQYQSAETKRLLANLEPRRDRMFTQQQQYGGSIEIAPQGGNMFWFSPGGQTVGAELQKQADEQKKRAGKLQ